MFVGVSENGSIFPLEKLVMFFMKQPFKIWEYNSKYNQIFKQLGTGLQQLGSSHSRPPFSLRGDVRGSKTIAVYT